MRIIHLFNYKLEDINVSKVKEQGFEAIQISPIQPCKEGEEWWKLYQPFDFAIGNKLGNKKDLINLCSRAAKEGIKIIADVVLNHVAGVESGEIEPHEKVNKRLLKEGYLKDKHCIYNWGNRWEVTHNSVGLPTLNTYNLDIQLITIDFLNELIHCGVGGFRFDSAKNIALPEENCSFWVNVLNGLKEKNLFNYAEVINSTTQLIEAYQKHINVLTDGYSWDKEKLIVFPFSHDTDLEFGYTKNMSDSMCIEEYKVLAGLFPHTIFYARQFNLCWENEEIKKINMRCKSDY